MHDELTTVPSVGPSIAADLRHLGIHSIRELAEADPEALYARLREITGHDHDPCVLYTFRCAVYAARTPPPEQEQDLLKWWNWKDRRLDPVMNP